MSERRRRMDGFTLAHGQDFAAAPVPAGPP